MFNRQPKFESHSLSYKQELTILCYTNKAFVYILKVGLKIPVLHQKRMCYMLGTVYCAQNE